MDQYIVTRGEREEGPFTLEELRRLVASGGLKANDKVARQGGSDLAAREVPGLFSDKPWLTSWFLAAFLGVFGADHFFLGRSGTGILKLVTCGGAGMWLLFDLVMLATGNAKDGKGQRLVPATGKQLAIGLGVTVLFYAIAGASGPAGNRSGAPADDAGSGAVTAGLAAGAAPVAAHPAGLQVPAPQAAFVRAVLDAKKLYRDADNELQKSAVRTSRKAAVSQIFARGKEVAGWLGTISDMGTTSDGKAHIKIELHGGGVHVSTHNNGLSDIGADTLIGQDSPLFATLASLKEGDRVVFAGTLLPDGQDRDFIVELSMSESGSMTGPDYGIRLSNVAKQ